MWLFKIYKHKQENGVERNTQYKHANKIDSKQ